MTPGDPVGDLIAALSCVAVAVIVLSAVVWGPRLGELLLIDPTQRKD